MVEGCDPNTALTRRPRVLLAEDHPLVQQVIHNIVDGCCDVVGLVTNSDEVLESACRLLPDVIVLDISLSGQSAMQLLPHLRAALPDTAIVMLTTLTQPVYRVEALARGADAFVVKGRAMTDLLPAIGEALATARLQRRRA